MFGIRSSLRESARRARREVERDEKKHRAILSRQLTASSRQRTRFRIVDCKFKKQKTKILLWERLSSRDSNNFYDFYDFYGFYDLNDFNDLPFTVYRLLPHYPCHSLPRSWFFSLTEGAFFMLRWETLRCSIFYPLGLIACLNNTSICLAHLRSVNPDKTFRSVTLIGPGLGQGGIHPWVQRAL